MTTGSCCHCSTRRPSGPGPRRPSTSRTAATSRRPPWRPAPSPSEAYHKDRFTYDAVSDTYTCPQGQTLTFCGLVTQRQGQPKARKYRASKRACAACPVRAHCTTAKTTGRSLAIGADEAPLRAHRTFMATDGAKTTSRRRTTLPEPAFGILKEQQAARRFLLRGLANVQAEWSRLATAFNLRTLARIWRATHHPRLAAA